MRILRVEEAALILSVCNRTLTFGHSFRLWMRRNHASLFTGVCRRRADDCESVHFAGAAVCIFAGGSTISAQRTSVAGGNGGNICGGCRSCNLRGRVGGARESNWKNSGDYYFCAAWIGAAISGIGGIFYASAGSIWRTSAERKRRDGAEHRTLV